MLDMEDDVFQAHCQIDFLRDHLEQGGTIRHVRDDLVTLDLPDNSYTEVNLRPVQHLLTELRKLTK